ncbi:hypothetical protein M422DRAFT_30280, partial [Sphaerobolus stellatus SS14]
MIPSALVCTLLLASLVLPFLAIPSPYRLPSPLLLSQLTFGRPLIPSPALYYATFQFDNPTKLQTHQTMSFSLRFAVNLPSHRYLPSSLLLSSSIFDSRYYHLRPSSVTPSHNSTPINPTRFRTTRDTMSLSLRFAIYPHLPTSFHSLCYLSSSTF